MSWQKSFLEEKSKIRLILVLVKFYSWLTQKKYLKMNKTCICHLNLAEKESKYYNIFCYISECVPRLALVSQNAPKLDRPYDFRILSWYSILRYGTANSDIKCLQRLSLRFVIVSTEKESIYSPRPVPTA